MEQIINSIESVYSYLRQIDSNHESLNSSIIDFLANEKTAFLNKSDDESAKEIWILEQINRIQSKYLEIFELQKHKDYFKAWCELEQCEIALDSLIKHYTVEENDEFKIKFINKVVRQFQKLYPYKLFISSEIAEKEIVCSICGEVISARNYCGHKIGEIYNGEYCHRIVKKADFLGTAIVENPVHKYSVLFSVDPKTNLQIDHYNYGLLEYLMVRLLHPFADWDYEEGVKKKSHDNYKNIGRNEPCPCGSNKKYKKCCLPKEYVELKNIEFIFHEPPNDKLLNEKIEI